MHCDAPNDHQADPRGWISLWRRIVDHPIYSDSEALHVWIDLLLHATHRPLEVRFAGRILTLQPGQLLSGRLAIAARTRVSESKVQRVLSRLKTEHLIEQQTSNRCSIITVLNWTRYQKTDQQNEQPSNSHRTTSEQPSNTNNNRITDNRSLNNNVSSTSECRPLPQRATHDGQRQPVGEEHPTLERLSQYSLENGLADNSLAPEKFYASMQRTGWRIRGEAVRDWRLALSGFCEQFEEDRRNGGARNL